jgi:4-diphosphocytidyl-2-C-methyl-D-erythritol kinase
MNDKPQFEATDSGLLVRAPAKINLSLLIAGKRPDGFHAIETVMAKVDYYDEVTIEPGRQPGVELVCQGPHWAPDGPDNLVYRAARQVLDFTARPIPLRITLTKNIPAGTGLGSASSDAAATLLGLNRYLNLDLSLDALSGMAATLGSDVTFFLHGPLAYCTGRGEDVTPLPLSVPFTALLILPGITVSTAAVYKHYRHDQQLYEDLHRKISVPISENRIDLLAKICTNMLSKACFGLETDLATLKHKIDACGMGPVNLSGSGSALFCMVDGGVKRAREIQRTIDQATNCLTRVVTRNCW